MPLNLLRTTGCSSTHWHLKMCVSVCVCVDSCCFRAFGTNERSKRINGLDSTAGLTRDCTLSNQIVLAFTRLALYGPAANSELYLLKITLFIAMWCRRSCENDVRWCNARCWHLVNKWCALHPEWVFIRALHISQERMRWAHRNGVNLPQLPCHCYEWCL